MKKWYFLLAMSMCTLINASSDAKINTAIKEHDSESLTTLLNAGGNINGEHNNWTHLQTALNSTDFQSLSYNLQLKGNGDFDFNDIPLHHLPKHVQCLQVVLNARPNINATSGYGDNALSSALDVCLIAKPRDTIPQPARLLIRRGGILTEKNIESLAKTGHYGRRIVSLLVAQQRLLNQENNSTNTAETSLKERLFSLNSYMDQTYWTSIEPCIEEDIQILKEDKKTFEKEAALQTAYEYSLTANLPTTPSCTIL